MAFKNLGEVLYFHIGATPPSNTLKVWLVRLGEGLPLSDVRIFNGVFWQSISISVGVPAGGTTGQVLTKISNADGNADWQDPQGNPPDDVTIELNNDNKLQIKDGGVSVEKIEDLPANTVWVNNTASDAPPTALPLGANEFLGRGASGNIAAIGVFDAIAGVGTLVAGSFVFSDASITSASIVLATPLSGGTLTDAIRANNTVAGQVTFTAGGADTATFNFLILNP